MVVVVVVVVVGGSLHAGACNGSQHRWNEEVRRGGTAHRDGGLSTHNGAHAHLDQRAGVTVPARPRTRGEEGLAALARRPHLPLRKSRAPTLCMPSNRTTASSSY